MQKSPTVFNRYKQQAEAERFAAAYKSYAQANPTEDEKIAQRKVESADRLAALKSEEEKLKLGDSSIGLEWSAQADSYASAALKARADATDAIYAATGKDEDFRKQRERDLQNGIDERNKARIAKVANGRPINAVTEKYFDDTRAPYDDVASRKKEWNLTQSIKNGNKPGVNKAYLDQTKQELELLLEQRRRLNPEAIKQGDNSLYDRVQERLQDNVVVHPPKQEQIDPAKIGTAGNADNEASRDLFNTIQRKRELSEQYGAKRNDGYYGGTQYYLENAAKSAPLMAGSMAASVLGSPALGAAVMFGGVAAPEYGDRRNRGDSIESSIGGATLAGFAEGAGEYISAGALGTLHRAGSLAGRSAASRGGRAALAVAGEVVGEDVTELINIGTDIVYDGKTVTVNAAVKRLIDSGAIAVAMTGPTSAPLAYAMHPPNHANAADAAEMIRQVMTQSANPAFGNNAEAASESVPDLGQGQQSTAADQSIPADQGAPNDTFKQLVKARAASQIALGKREAAKSALAAAQAKVNENKIPGNDNKLAAALGVAQSNFNSAASVSEAAMVGSINANTAAGKVDQNALNKEIEVEKKAINDAELATERAKNQATSDANNAAKQLAIDAKAKAAADALAAATTASEVKQANIASEKAKKEQAQLDANTAKQAVIDAKVAAQAEKTAAMLAREQERNLNPDLFDAKQELAGVNSLLVQKQADIDFLNAKLVLVKESPGAIAYVKAKIEAVIKAKTKADNNKIILEASIASMTKASSSAEVTGPTAAPVEAPIESAPIESAPVEITPIATAATEAPVQAEAPVHRQVTAAQKALDKANGLANDAEYDASKANDSASLKPENLDLKDYAAKLANDAVKKRAAANKAAISLKSAQTNFGGEQQAQPVAPVVKPETSRVPTFDANNVAVESATPLEPVVMKPLDAPQASERVSGFRASFLRGPENSADFVLERPAEPAQPTVQTPVEPVAQEQSAVAQEASQSIPVQEQAGIEESWADQINAVPEGHVAPKPRRGDEETWRGDKGSPNYNQRNAEERVARESQASAVPEQSTEIQSPAPLSPEASRSAQRAELVRIKEEALLAGRAGQEALRINGKHTEDTHRENWREFNDAALKLKTFDDGNQSQGGIEYSRSSAPVSGLTEARITQLFNDKFGRGAFERAIKTGRLQLHESPDVLDMEAGTKGFYQPLSNGQGDVVHLFASELSEANIEGVLLHEYAHRGFVEAVGGEANAKEIYDRLRELGKTDLDIKRAIERARQGGGNIDRETLSYYLEEMENSGREPAETLMELISRKVRAGVYNFFKFKMGQNDGAAAFKRKILNIARASLKAQLQSDAKEQKANAKRAAGEAALNPGLQATNFDGLDKNVRLINSLTKGLFDATEILYAINEFQKTKGTYSVDTDMHIALNVFKDSIAGQSFGLKARQYNLIKKIKESGLNDWDVGVWAAINYKPDADIITGKPNGSGITQEFADREYARLLPHKEALDGFVKVLTDNHKEALEIRKNLQTEKEYEARVNNPKYVALRGSDNKEIHGRLDVAVPGTYNLNVLGNEYKAEKARDSAPKYRDIIAHSFADLEQSRMRNSWNEAMITIAKFAIANRNNGMVKFQPATKVVVRNPITGVDEIRHKNPLLDGKFINFKNKGIPYTLEMTNDRFEQAIKSKSKKAFVLLRPLAWMMGKFQGAVLKNVNFAVIQKIRDTQEISLYLTLHFGPKVAARAIVLHSKALDSFRRAMNDRLDLSNPTDVALKKWLDEGGLTQISSPESVDVITERVRRLLAPEGFLQGAKGAYAAIKSLVDGNPNGYNNGFLDSLKDMIDASEKTAEKLNITFLAENLEKLQTIGENIGRFTAYQAILEANPTMHPKTALWHSKESGANFSVKGAWAANIGAFMPFYNAIAAGALSNKKYFFSLAKNKKALFAFGVAVSSAVALGFSNADDNDEDGKSKYLNRTIAERAGNVCFNLFGHEFKMPLQQGAIAAINMVAQSVGPMARLMSEGDEKGQDRLYEDIAKGVLKNMGPDIGMTGEVDLGPLSTLVESVQNKNEFGMPLDYRPEDEKNFSDYRSGRAEHFLEGFIPGYTKEIWQTGTVIHNSYKRNDAMGSEYAVNKALEETRGLPLFKIFLASATGKAQASKRILYDVKNAIAEEKKRVKKIFDSGDVEGATGEMEKSPLLAQGSMSSKGSIKLSGDDLAGRTGQALKEIARLKKIKRKWYNRSEFSDDLGSETTDYIDTSDIKTENFNHYRSAVIEKINNKVNRIFAEYKDK